MNLDAIAIFTKVVQCGSFTQAAKLLKMPISTVSAKVSSLERSLGVTLLQRTTRKLQVTEAGETYFKGCIHALEEIQTAEAQITRKQKEPQGILKITSSVDVGNNVLPDIVARFLEKYQHMEVELLITNRVIDLVGEGVDLAIRAGELKDSTLIAKKFMTEQLSLWASPLYLKNMGTPSHPRELNQHEFIRYTFEKDKMLKLSNGEETLSIAVPSRVVLDSTEAAKRLTLLGQGIGLLHDFLNKDDAKDGKIIKILPQWHWHNLPYYFVFPPQRFISSKIRTFITVSEEYMRKFYHNSDQEA
jgi:DNA-binding transcriptional LysR family regulator